MPLKLAWQTARIEAIADPTPRIRSLVLRVGWQRPFRAGQYVDVRLTAPDGYQAQRSYSIASAPIDPERIELMIERLEGGEVSGFFHEVAEVGDEIELRGPIGNPFTWAPVDGGPVLLCGGGSGVVPLLSMVRERTATADTTPMLLLHSVRTLDEVIARRELTELAAAGSGFQLILALTRQVPPVPGTHGRRIDGPLVAEALARLPAPPRRVFVCGANRFVGPVADLLVDQGVEPAIIRTERYGE